MKNERNSYSRIVKSSSLIGGAQGINILIGMIRVKFVAVLIGPIGVGLVATYQSIIQLVGTVAGFGLQSSAVREIAQLVEKGDHYQIGRTVLSLKRMCRLTGVLGSTVILILSKPLSQITFNSPEYSTSISLVGLTILFANLKGGQMALIQGMRCIGDLAKLNVISAVTGTIISIGLYWTLGIDGIVPAIVLLGLTELCASWWYARKIQITEVKMTWIESFQAAGGMVKLGLAFMWSGLLISLVAYFTRTIIANEIDIIAVGVFAAAFALSGLIVNFILGAMGADYYPSLTAINADHKKMRDLVNQQTEIGLLLALPGLLATLAFSPWIIKLFYTSEFHQSADLLRWFAIGCMGRVISWPLGFIILAKGLSRLFVITETVINIVHVFLIISLLELFGLEGVAIAYPILYLSHAVMMLFISKYLIEFSWNKEVWWILTLSTMVVITILSIVLLLPLMEATAICIIIIGIVCIFSLRGLLFRLGREHKIYRIIDSTPFINIFFR